MSDTKNGRGRPSLTPEELETRRIERNKRSVAWQKSTGYAAQKRYKESHPEQRALERARYRAKTYEVKVRIPMELKATVESLTQNTGLSITQLFISAVEEKYGVVLHRDIDKRS